MPGPLVLFDVDGTLCDTFDVDDRVFCEVASNCLGVRVAPSSWRGAPQITDTGIVDWLWRKHCQRPPSATEVQTFASRFAAGLVEEFSRSPAQFRQVPGAAELVAHLAEIGWRFAFATGGWARAARFKLEAAQLPLSALLASSDDSSDRLTIFSLARARASLESEAVVLLGDGAWDVRVAQTFGWSFVGVGRDAREDVLRKAGAQVVVPHFSDLEGVVALIGAAPRPRDLNGNHGGAAG
jgi:phosphoglycolate phosphatase-like HAD superfamily hydrolase